MIYKHRFVKQPKFFLIGIVVGL